MSYGKIDWQKISHDEGHNEGYIKGFQDGFQKAYSMYVNPGSVWIEKVDIENNIHYHCSACDHEVTEKVDICPRCLARMQMNKEITENE